MKKLVIIDGKSVFYRGYYAMGNLSLSDGTPISGVYGFAAISLELVKRIQPDKVVVAWDKAKTSISKRKEIYADYKAGRVKPPDDFYAQIPILRELVDALSWGFLECDGYEADDIIGTLAKQTQETAWQTYIISSDLDMLQVVGPNVKMYRLLKGFSELEEMDVAAVEAKYGIKKKQFLDLKALKGDASDNIPGVPGIGEKGAVKLLTEYDSLDGIYAHIDEIKGAIHDKLVAGKDSAYMSYKLATIITDAPVKLADVPDFQVNVERVLGELKKLEFKSLIRRFLAVLRERGIEVPETEGKAEEKVQNREIKVPKGLLIFPDIKEKMHQDESFSERIFQGEKFWDLGQGKFLLNPLERSSVEDEGLKQKSLALPETSEQEQEWEAEYIRQREEFNLMPKLYKIFTEYDLPLIPVLYKMEKRGIKLDLKYFSEMLKELGEQVEELEKKIYTLAGREFNVNSPLQLSDVLYGDLGLPTKGVKKTVRGYSTGVRELAKMKDLHPVIPALMEYREMAKLLNTYVAPLPGMVDESGRIHTTFTQNVTATGRLSSFSPNLQNIPVRTEEGKKVRKGFVAAPGKKLVSADYAQFELRLAAVLAGDKELIADFNSGIDIHTKTAADVFSLPMDKVSKTQRRAAKVINFGVLYGMSAKGLSEAAGMNLYTAKKFIDDYFRVRRPIRDYLDKTLRQAREKGYVETFYGRRRPTPDVKSANFVVRQAAERAAANMPIQGTEADLMKRAMILVDQKLPEGADLVLQIHDSLIVECDEELVSEVTEILREVMEGVAPELEIKLAVEVTSGGDWGEL